LKGVTIMNAFARLLVPSVLACFGGLALSSGVAHAQETPAQPAAAAPAWTDPEFAKVAGLLSGSWKSSKPVAVGDQSYDIIMNVAPVTIGDVPNAMYAEISRSDAPDKPYRQAIWRLYRRQGEIRLQTLEFRRKGGEFGSITGLWAAPETFPKTVSMSDLVGTLDIQLKATADGFAGKTPQPYPTAAGGATEMTSEISVNATTFTSADRGFDASGNVVWGPAQGESYAFSRVESPVQVSRMDGGLVVLNYPTETKGEQFAPGTKITVHYIGQLLDTGYVFDASYERGSPYTYEYGQTLIQGWTTAMADARTGMKRRIVIPGPLAYGERGNPRAKIGPNATLVFAIDVLNVEKTAQPEPAQQNFDIKPVQPGAAGGEQPKPVEAKPVDVKPADEKKPQ
jgi:hypothetical protein